MIQSNILKIPTCVKVFISIMRNQTFLVSSSLLSNRFIHVPSFITISKTEDKLLFKSKKLKEEVLLKFVSTVRVWMRLSERPSRKKFFLKGLGYKAHLSEDKKYLFLKIGLSHLVKIFTPLDKIRLKINKKMITAKGSSSTEVGNFVERIRRLRIPDSYKGKGIWYKNENRVLKVLKKK